MQSIKDKVTNRIRGCGRGSVHTNKDFLDLGSRGAVDVALAALVRQGVIRRVARGIYDYPDYNEELGGILGPDPAKVAKAAARRSGARIQPHGAYAANMLGLSTQVPAKIVYMTDSRIKDIQIGRLTIQFRQTGKMLPGSEVTAWVIAGVRFMGRNGVTRRGFSELRRRLTAGQLRTISREARYAEGWVYDVLRLLCEPAPEAGNG